MPPTPRLKRPTSPGNAPPAAALFGGPTKPRECPCPSPKAPAATIVAPLVRCAELAMWDGHPVALTGWLEAEQAELTVLHRSEDGAVTATAYRFCASRDALEPTGQHAHVPAA